MIKNSDIGLYSWQEAAAQDAQTENLIQGQKQEVCEPLGLFRLPDTSP